MSHTKFKSSSLFGEEVDDDSFWMKLMAECLQNNVTKLASGKKLLVLGDNDAEKTRLISKLQEGTPDSSFRKGNGLEYKYITVKDEYCDNQSRLGVWILDEDPHYTPLLKYALNEESLAETTVLLMASMTKPWDIFKTIETWTEILKSHIESMNLSEGELEERKNKILERYREYVEPGLSIYGSLAADNTRELPINLGIEIIVVITRTEYMRELQTEFGYEEEHFDFIQLSLREFCLSRGAALFYVSVKEDKNCDLLLKYILHKIYAFPFRLPAVLVERDSILVPAGWDTKNKIKFLSDSLSTIPTTTPFTDVVFRPSRLSGFKNVAPEVVAQSDQEFLAAMQSALESQVTEENTAEAAKDTSSMTATVVQRNVARRMTRSQTQRNAQVKIEPKLEGDNTLSNFFHSLLNRRTSAPVDRPSGLSGSRTFTPKSIPEDVSKRNGNISKKDSGPDGIKGDQFSTQQTDNFGETSDENFRKLKNTVHASLDQDKETQQLPEYFLSNLGFCATDCSFQKDSTDSSFDLEDEFSPPLDRVKSAFNPPIKMLLESSSFQRRGDTVNKEPDIANGSVNGLGDHPKDDCKVRLPSASDEPDSVMTSMPCRKISQDGTET